MSGEKRKRSVKDHGERSCDKKAKAIPTGNIKVSVLPDTDEWIPILASTPGLSFPSNFPLKPYKRPHQHVTPRPRGAGRSALPASEILLHTSAHPKLDYEGREEDAGGSEPLLKHYVGVYDPVSGELQLVQVRKVAVRGTLRSSKINEISAEDKEKPPTTLSARSTLGLTFGTKKSQKAIRSLTENAIQASPTKSLKASPGKSALDPLASAVVESMAVSTSSMPTREELQNAADENKPRPTPNLNAETPADVYPVEELVGLGTLKFLTVKEWQDKVENGEDIVTKSRYVSARVRHIVQSGDVRKLKTLRYLLLLLDWSRCLKPGTKGGKRVPTKEELKTAIDGVGSELLDGVGKRFAEGTELNKWHLDNLTTHICALALTIDNFATDIHDLCYDLRLETKDTSKYFHELGCKVSPPTEPERAKMKISKPEAAVHKVAKLKLPLEFPKIRNHGVGRRRK